MTSLRKIEVLREGKWSEVRLAEVKKGEVFRYEEDGTVEVLTAASDGYWVEEGKFEPTLRAQAEKKNAAILIE